MHNPGSNGRKYAQSRIPGPAVCTTLDSRPAVCRRLHTFGERLQTKASSCDPLRAGWQSPRLISADRASSCDPHGRGLNAQPWIQWPEVCTTLDPRASSMHNPGFKASSMQTSAYIWRTSANKGQQYANVCIHSENVCKPRPAAAIPCGPVGSCDPWGPGSSSIE